MKSVPIFQRLAAILSLVLSLSAVGLPGASPGAPGDVVSSSLRFQDVALRRIATPDGDLVSDARMDSRGTLHIVLAHEHDAFYSRLEPGAAALSGLVRINSRPGSVVARGEAGPKLDLGRDGELYVVWHRWNDPVVDVLFSRSIDGGRTFEKETLLGAGLLPNLAVGPSGQVYVVWLGDQMGRGIQGPTPLSVTFSADGGRSFVPVSSIPGVPIPCGCCLPDIAARADGSLLIAYRGAEQNVRDIHLLRSLHGVYKFSRTLVHPDNWVLNACPNSGPAVVTDGSGANVGVAWSSQGIALLAISTNGGQDFAPPDRLPDDVGEIDSYPLRGFDERGGAGLAWRSVKRTRAIVVRDDPGAIFVGASGIFAREAAAAALGAPEDHEAAARPKAPGGGGR